MLPPGAGAALLDGAAEVPRAVLVAGGVVLRAEVGAAPAELLAAGADVVVGVAAEVVAERVLVGVAAEVVAERVLDGVAARVVGTAGDEPPPVGSAGLREGAVVAAPGAAVVGAAPVARGVGAAVTPTPGTAGGAVPVDRGVLVPVGVLVDVGAAGLGVVGAAAVVGVAAVG